MRTLHADLTTAQQGDSVTPYIELNFRSRSGVTTRSFKTTDSVNRIQLVQQAEGRYGGQIAVPGSQDIAAIIQLRDADNSLVVLDWKGYRLDIAWGYNTTSGNRAVALSPDENGEGEPLYVVRQRSVSEEGELYLELECASLWGMMNRLWLNRTSTAPIEYKKGTSNEAEIIEIVHELLGGSTPGTPTTPLTGAVVTFDAGLATYTDRSSAAQSRTEDDVPLPPFDSSGIGDITYFAQDVKFNRVSKNLTTPGVGTVGIIWESWNGSSWATISPAVTGDGIFQVGQLVISNLNDGHLASWVAINLNTTGFGGVGPDAAFPNAALFYVRARCNGQTSFTTAALASFVTMAMDFASQMDSSDEAEMGFKPNYESELNEPLSTTLKGILSRVRLRTVLQKDGFHTRFVDKDQVGQDYSYSLSGAHAFFSAVLEEGPIIPNEIVVINKDPGVAGGVEGSASDSVSIAAIGNITWVVKEESVTSAGEADSVAQAMIDSLIWDSVAGDIEVPMNVGQEVWDKIEVIDSRSGETFTGFISGLERIYEPGTYRLRIHLGGLDRIVQPRWLIQAQRHVAPAQEVERRQRAIQTARSSPLDPEIASSVLQEVRITPRSPNLDPSPDFSAEGGGSLPSSPPRRIQLDNPMRPFGSTPFIRGGSAMAIPLDVIFSPDEPRWANPVTYNPDRNIELVREHTRPDRNVLTEKILLYFSSAHQATISGGTGGGPIFTVENDADDIIFEWTGNVGAVRPFGVSKHPNFGAAGNFWGTLFTDQIALIDKTADPLANGEIQLNSADVKVFSGGAVRNLSDIASGGGAPVGSPFVTIGNDGTLTDERALTGSINQVIITDNGANSTVVLTLPQQIHSTATVVFGSLTLSNNPNALLINDDGRVLFGNGLDFWFEFDTATSRFEFWMTNSDGAGLDAIVWSINDGDLTTTFAGNIGATAGINMVITDITNIQSLQQTGTEATAGFIRLTNNSFLEWRNAANSANIGFGLTTSDEFLFDTAINLSSQNLLNFNTLQQSGVQATQGAIRLVNNNAIEWRNAANGANIGFNLNASDQFIIDGPLISSADNQDDLGSASNIWQDIFGRQFHAHDAATVAQGKMYGSNSPSDELIVEGVNDVAISTDGGADTGTITLNGFVHHPMRLIRKTANETVNNSTTLQNDDHLLFTIAANEIWIIEYYLHFESNTLADFKVGITFPSGATGRKHVIGVDIADPDRIGELTAFSLGIITGVFNAPGSGTSDTYILVTYIVVNGGNAGTIQLQWAQNSAHASNTILFANSYLKAHRF